MHIHVLKCFNMGFKSEKNLNLNNACTVKHERHFISVMIVEITGLDKSKLQTYSKFAVCIS